MKRKVQPNQLFDHNYGDDAVPSNHVPTANKKPPTKPQAKEDELGKLLESGVADYMNNSGEEDEKSDGENIITEEQYLEERNDLVKKQLLMDSSSESIISDEEFDDLHKQMAIQMMTIQMTATLTMIMNLSLVILAQSWKTSSNSVKKS